MGKKKKKESMEEKLYNLQAQQLAAQVANWAAQLEFQKERFRLLEMPQFQQGLQLEVDKFAWDKAQDTWERAYQEAAITGTYQGQPTTQWLMDQARLTGTFQGERTLEGKLTDAQIKDMNDKMKLANDQFLAATTGFFNGQRTFDREKFEAAQALEGWKFMATLTGPQNAYKQARAIASMPGGVDQMMQAFAGQYMLPSGAAVGSGGAGYGAGQLNDLMMREGAPVGGPQSPLAQPPMQAQPVVPPGQTRFLNIPGRGFAPSQWNQATRDAVAAWNAANPGFEADGSQQGYRSTGPGVGTGGGAIAPGTPPVTPAPYPQGYTYQPPGVQAPANVWNYSATADGSTAAYPPGVVSPAQTADVSSNAPMNPLLANSLVNQPYQYGGQGTQAPQQSGGGMVDPNKINAQNYTNAYNYQKELLWAGYEDQGWDKSLAQESYLKSLPQYGGITKGAVAF